MSDKSLNNPKHYREHNIHFPLKNKSNIAHSIKGEYGLQLLVNGTGDFFHYRVSQILCIALVRAMAKGQFHRARVQMHGASAVSVLFIKI